MTRLDQFKKHLKAGEVYRRAVLAQWSNAVDREISSLVKEGLLEKLSPGLYYAPRKTAFGAAPPALGRLFQNRALSRMPTA